MYVYIKEMKNDIELINNLNIPIWLKNINIIYRKKFNIVTIEKINDEHYLYIIPKVSNVKILKKIVNKNKNNSIILSKDLERYKKELSIKTKKISKYFIYNILKYIEDKIKIKVEMQNIYFLANYYNIENLDIINSIINKVKTVTIVTNSIKNYSIIEDRIYNTEGILITVTNNKKSALKNANIIINLDYNIEEITKYKLNNNSIIINCIDDQINIDFFQGIIVNNIEIDFKKDKQYEILDKEFYKNDIYLSIKSTKDKYIDFDNNIEENSVQIKNLLGNKGIINKYEFNRILKYC